MYSKTTESVIVTVVPQYEEGCSVPLNNLFVWSYRVHIRNTGAEDMQLISRRWIVVDSDGHIEDIRGEGVVGLQPVLKSGDEFEYSSSVRLNAPSGVMMGYYEMEVVGKDLDLGVEVPAFSLDCPNIKRVMN